MVSRRGFVKGCLAASAAGAAAVGSYAAWRAFAPPPPATPPGRVDYVGAKLLSGPATRGVPLMPLQATDAGQLVGDPRAAGVPAGVLDWYRYCAHERAPGLVAGYAGDDAYRYFRRPETPPPQPDWYGGKVGEVARRDDFAVGEGALVTWRSAGQRGKDILVGNLVCVDATKLVVDDGLDLRGFLVPAARGGMLLAYWAVCPHFCCLLGYHASVLAERQGYGNDLFCNCHFVVCDPLRIVRDAYVLPPPA